LSSEKVWTRFSEISLPFNQTKRYPINSTHFIFGLMVKEKILSTTAKKKAAIGLLLEMIHKTIPCPECT
jgi:hypothetical protein